MTDSHDLIRRLVDALKEESDWINNPKHDELIAEALVYLKETSPAPSKEQRPDRLVVGDIWEFETDVKVKGKRKLQTVTLQWEVKGFHHGECAWQLESLDGKHYIYLWEHSPQYEEMTYIGTKSND
jgi:hypothetical protein